MAMKSPQQLLELLKQSRLLSPEQLDGVHEDMLLTNDVAVLLDMLVEREILTEWQKAQLLAGRTGFFIGNYVLLDMLGRGGMGSVFLARHTTMNRRCAVKVVSKKVGKDPDSLDQFLTEARAIASLDHPNIVQAYDVDKENDHFYIVMEYVEGQSLDELLQHEGVLDCESAVDCICQAAQGLAHAHGRNMVHCDIKPSNLLVNEQGVVKILDMGMARLVGESGISNSDSRSNERILGTVDYMAPEQAVAAPSFDFRADIYSLGCTLFALLVGHPPFNEGNLTQRILKHQTQAPPDLRKLRPDVPVDLANICMKMMAKDPGDRYQTVEEVANLLAGWTMPEFSEEEVAEEGPAHDTHEPPPLPDPNAFDEEALGGAEAVAGPALGTAAHKKKSFWEDERILLPILGVVGVVVVGLLVFLVVASSGSNNTTPSPSNPTASNPPASSVQGGDTTGIASSESKLPATSETPEEPEGDTGSSDSATEPAQETDAPKAPLDFGTVKPESTEPAEFAPASTDTTPEETAPPKPQLPDNPLAELQSTADLPSSNGVRRSDVKRPMPLGHLLLGENQQLAKSLQIKLIGGNTALAHNTFSIAKSSPNGLPEWTVFLTTNNKTKLKVAQLWVDKDSNLMFRWLIDDKNVPAGQLRACAIKVTAGDNTHRMQFIQVKQVAPMRIVPLQNIHTSNVTPLVRPSADALRLKLTDYKGPFSKISYDPSPVIKPNERTDAILSGNGLPTLTINFEYEVKGLTAELKAWCWYTPLGTPKGGRRLRVSLDNSQRIGKFLFDLEKQKRMILLQNSNNPKQVEKVKQINEEQNQLKNLLMLFTELKGITKPEDIPETFQGLGTFRFEEYIETGQGKIQLLETKN